jgi:hypothetical protein
MAKEFAKVEFSRRVRSGMKLLSAAVERQPHAESILLHRTRGAAEDVHCPVVGYFSVATNLPCAV